MSDSRDAAAPSIAASGVGRHRAAAVHRRRHPPLRRDRVGDSRRRDRRPREPRLRAAWRRVPRELVAERDQHRGPEVLPRPVGSPERESSVKQMIGRVSGTIAGWGRDGGYFATDEDAARLRGRAHPHPASTRWRRSTRRSGSTSGSRSSPQCSACFILSVEDTIESILDWNTKEGMIFRGGSGSGINLSNIRASKEHLSKGGTASGPVSFMRGADAWAGTIKSGGKTRRAAKMVVLDVDHPDILDFVWCKAREEEKAGALRDAGFDMRLDSEHFASIQYQNANNSVRVSDDFMEAVEQRRGVGPHGALRTARWSTSIDARERARPDRRRGLALRRPGRPVRHHDQRLAHLPELGPDQRVQPVLRVHARRRLGLQPRVAQPHEVPPRGRHVRRGRLRARRWTW